MARLKCKKCGAVFEKSYKPLDSLVRLGPYKTIPVSSLRENAASLTPISSVKDPITWPPQEKKQEQQTAEPQLTEEEQEKKRIEESKYEKA